MTASTHYHQCPACQSNSIAKVLSCKDYLVSNETFDIYHCSNCTLRFTQDVPTAAYIAPYYQSEDYISHSDSEKGLINRLYKIARRFTLASKRKLLLKETGLATGSLLDTGCGTGAFLNEMKHAGWQVTGLEPDAGARKKAAALYQLAPLPPEQLFVLPAASFDAITLWHVLEHVHELDAYFREFRRLLSKKGKLVIAVPNYTSRDAGYYQRFWAAYDVPRHLYHFSPAAMEQLAKKYGFLLKTMRPMMLDAYYISMLSEKYKNGGNLVKALAVGISCTFATLRNTRKSSSVIYLFE